MWLCIFSHSAIKLTRVELQAKRPTPTIEHGDWTTRLIASCDDSETAARGAKKVIDALNILLKDKRLAPGVYQLPFETVLEAYNELMLYGQSVKDNPKPKPAEYYGYWAIIIALGVWQWSVHMLAVFIWAILMLFLGGAKAGNVLLVVILLRLADTQPRVQYLLKEVRKL